MLELPNCCTNALRELHLRVGEVESVADVIHLPALIGGALEQLCYGKIQDDSATVDLSALAKACPKLERLVLEVSAVVSEYDEPLQNWPLRKFVTFATVNGLAPS